VSTKNAEFRRAAKNTISESDRFSQFKTFGLWDKRVNADDLPAFAVGIPSWGLDRHDTLSSQEQITTLIIAVKRSGEGLEDLGDADADEIIHLLSEHLEDDYHELSVNEVTYQQDASGEVDVSTLALKLNIKFWPKNA